MPSSKRDKVVSLTKVKKKTKESKQAVIEEIRKSVETYKNIFCFTLENLRGSKFVEVRQKFKSNSRFYYGKNHLMAVAFGRKEEDEIAKDVHKIANILKGECGIMFTNEPIKNIKSYFEEFSEDDFSRAGTKVERKMELSKGLLPGVAGTLEPQLRKLGLPTKLMKGEVELLRDFVICSPGDVLTPEQATILKIFDMKTVSFKIMLKAHWSKEKGFKEYDV